MRRRRQSQTWRSTILGRVALGRVQANVDRWFNQFTEPSDQINAKVEHGQIRHARIPIQKKFLPLLAVWTITSVT